MAASSSPRPSCDKSFDSFVTSRALSLSLWTFTSVFLFRFNLVTIKLKRRSHDIFYWLFWNPYYYIWREMRDAFIDPIAQPIQLLTYHEVFKYWSEATASFCWYFSFTNCLNFPWDSRLKFVLILRLFSRFSILYQSVHYTSSVQETSSSSDWLADSLCLFNHRVVFGERN